MQRRILFVDDEAPTRELVTLHLRRSGFLVATGKTADEGRARLASESFDLAVFDVDLAGENGMDLLVHARKVAPDLPVVIFTGLKFDGDLVAEARSRGAAGCLSKMQPLGELVVEIDRLLRRPGLESSAPPSHSQGCNAAAH